MQSSKASQNPSIADLKAQESKLGPIFQKFDLKIKENLDLDTKQFITTYQYLNRLDQESKNKHF